MKTYAGVSMKHAMTVHIGCIAITPNQNKNSFSRSHVLPTNIVIWSSVVGVIYLNGPYNTVVVFARCCCTGGVNEHAFYAYARQNPHPTER